MVAYRDARVEDDITEYVAERLNEGHSGQSIIETLVAGGWPGTTAREVVAKMKNVRYGQWQTQTLPALPPLPPVGRAPEAALAGEAVTPAPIRAFAPAPEGPEVPEGLTQRFPKTSEQTQLLVQKVQETWGTWSRKAEECGSSYAELREEMENSLAFCSPQRQGGLAALWSAAAAAGAALLAVGVGMGLTLQGYVLAPAMWLYLVGGGAAVGLAGAQVARLVSKRPRARTGDAPRTIAFARRVRAACTAERGYVAQVRADHQAVRREADAVLRLPGLAVSHKHQVPLGPSFVVSRESDVRGELLRVAELASSTIEGLDGAFVSDGIAAVDALLPGSTAADRRWWLRDGMNQRTVYSVKSLETARAHLRRQAEHLGAEAANLRAALPLAAPAAENAATTEPLFISADEYSEVARKLRALVQQLKRHGQDCVENVTILQRPLCRLRARFNEAACREGWSVRA